MDPNSEASNRARQAPRIDGARLQNSFALEHDPESGDLFCLSQQTQSRLREKIMLKQ
jgi:hypothetical protein